MSKLSSLPRMSREDLPGAPEWVDQLLQVSNEFQEQATQRINQNLLTGVFEDYKFVHGVEQVIKNPFGNSLPRGVSNVACQGLEVDSAGKTTGKLYALEVESMKWRVVQTRPGQPQRIGVTVRYAAPPGIVDLRRNAVQALASTAIVPVQFTVNEGGGTTSGTTITNGAFTFDVTTTTGSPATNSKITCNSPGFVDLFANVPFDTSVVGAKFAWLSKNNVAGTRWGINAVTVTGYFFSVPVARIQVSAGDYLQVFAYQDTGVSVNILDDTNNHARVMARYSSPALTATGRVTLRFDGGK